MSAPPEVLDEYFSARLRSWLRNGAQNASALLSGRYARMLSMWAWLVTGTVAQVEFAHGRNRRRASSSELWAHFAGKYITAEAERTFRIHMSRARRVGEANAARPALAAAPYRTRKRSAWDVFRNDYVAARMATGRGVQLRDPAYWQDVREAWAALTEEQRRLYEVEADLSRSAADVRRGAAAQRANAPLDEPAAAAPADLGLQLAVAPPVRPDRPSDLTMLAAAPPANREGTSVEDLCVSIPAAAAAAPREPIAEDQLARALQVDGGRRASMFGSYTAFCERQTHVSGGSRKLGQVKYPKAPRPCPFPNTEEASDLSAALATTLQDVVHQFGAQVGFM